VRRPFRGIEIKDDTYASIKVLRADLSEVFLFDSGRPPGKNSGTRYAVSNFIIQSVEDTRQEKSQIVETFGESFVFFFGERPRVLNVQGLLFNTLDFNWRTEFWSNYEMCFRGSKLAELGARIYLHWDDIVVEGYMMGATAQDNADMPYHIPFQFQLFVTNQTYLNRTLNDDYPTRSTYPADIKDMVDPNYVQNFAESVLTSEGGIKTIDILETHKDTFITAADTQKVVGTLTTLAEGASVGIVGYSLGNAARKQNTSPTVIKNTLTSALKLGIFSTGLTFMEVVSRYFRNKKMAHPVRKRPYRSKIWHNVDEYVGAPPGDAAIDQKAVAYGKSMMGVITTAKKAADMALIALQAADVDVLNHGDPNRLSPTAHGHTFGVSESISDSAFKSFGGE
jgi:hypothetical protein